jgi:hypothetical protein
MWYNRGELDSARLFLSLSIGSGYRGGLVIIALVLGRMALCWVLTVSPNSFVNLFPATMLYTRGPWLQGYLLSAWILGYLLRV